MNDLMNILNCSELIEETLAALRSGFEVEAVDDLCRITSPFFRRDGDPFEIVVRQSQNQFAISDDGVTLDFLELSGINLGSKTVDGLLDEVRRAHDVTMERGEILTRTSDPAQVGNASLRVLAAMNDISQLELTRRERTPRTFAELVEGELVGLGLPYETGVTKSGQTRERRFSFGINSGRNTVIEALSATSSTRAIQNASVLIVSVLDVWKMDPSMGAIAIVDDKRDVWSERALLDLHGNGLSVVLWSRRHESLTPAVHEPKRGFQLPA